MTNPLRSASRGRDRVFSSRLPVSATTKHRLSSPRAFVALAVTAIAVVAPSAASGHVGGRYGTVGDMERSLQRNSNVLMTVCNGIGRPLRRMPNLTVFEQYKHFSCYVVINSPYRQLCMTIHTLRNGRIFVSRAVPIQDAASGDCG